MQSIAQSQYFKIYTSAIDCTAHDFNNFLLQTICTCYEHKNLTSKLLVFHLNVLQLSPTIITIRTTLNMLNNNNHSNHQLFYMSLRYKPFHDSYLVRNKSWFASRCLPQSHFLKYNTHCSTRYTPSHPSQD